MDNSQPGVPIEPLLEFVETELHRRCAHSIHAIAAIVYEYEPPASGPRFPDARVKDCYECAARWIAAALRLAVQKTRLVDREARTTWTDKELAEYGGIMAREVMYNTPLRMPAPVGPSMEPPTATENAQE